jgi:hypothetical protein
MTELFAQPYDIAAEGFYFKTAEDMKRKPPRPETTTASRSRNTNFSS